MKAIKYYVKSMVIASLVALSPWLGSMFIQMKFIRWWHDEGSRICTATAQLDPQNHDLAPTVNASWQYGIHDYSSLRIAILLVFFVMMFFAVGIREWRWFEGD